MSNPSSNAADGTEAIISDQWGNTHRVWREQGVWVALRPESDDLDEYADAYVKDWTAV